MTNAENEIPDPKPGYLAEDMGGFAPSLPDGSWERLQARGKRRRRVAFWWVTTLLLTLGSLGGYGWYAYLSHLQNQNLAHTSTPVTNADPHPTTGLQSPPSSVSPSQSPKDSKTPPSTQARQTSTPPTHQDSSPGPAPRLTPKTQAKPLIEQPAPTPLAHTIHRAKATQEKQPLSRRTSGLASALVSPSRAKQKPESYDQYAEGEANAPGVYASTPLRPRSKSTRNETPSKPATHEAKDTNVQHTPSQGQTLLAETSQPASAEQVSSVQERRLSAVLQPPSDSTPQTPRRDTIPTLAQTDTPAKPEAATPTQPPRRRLHLELGLSALAWNGTAFAPYQLQPKAETARQASSLSPLVGGQFQAALLLPVWKSVSLRPSLGLSALNQRAEISNILGPDVPAVLSYNADSSQISGSPALSPSTQVERRLLLLPTAGLALVWQLGSWGITAGAQYTAISSVAETSGTSGQRPQVQPIGYQFGLRYSFGTRLLLQGDIRRLSFTQNALPGVPGSRGEGWLLGLGTILGF